MDGWVKQRQPAAWLAVCLVALALAPAAAEHAPAPLTGVVQVAEWTLANITCAKQGDYTAVWEIQGAAAESPMDGERPGQIRGVVVGNFQKGTGGPAELRGFFIQAHEPDCDADTSDGVFVYTGARIDGVARGDLVTIEGSRISEYQGPWSGWASPLTEVICTTGCSVGVIHADYGVPPAVDYSPPADPEAAAEYAERLEGMLVQVAATATVVAPTDEFHDVGVLRGAGRDRVRATDGGGDLIVVSGGGVDEADCGQDGLGAAATFDSFSYGTLTGATIVGPLTFSWYNYKIHQDGKVACPALVAGDHSSWDPFAAAPPVHGGGEVTMASMNVENFFDDYNDPRKSDPYVSPSEFAAKSRQLAAVVCSSDGLAKPAILGLQEIENQAVLDRLAADIAAGCGATYAGYTAVAPDPRGIQVGYLVRTDVVTVDEVHLRQGCSDVYRGVSYRVGDHPAGVSCSGATPYFQHHRPPLELLASVDVDGDGSPDSQVRVFNNHFKSKLPSSRCTAEDCTDFRVDEANSVRALVEARLAATPGEAIVVMGDLNDGVDTQPLMALRDGPLVSTWLDRSGGDGSQGSAQRYSHGFAKHFDALDHILISDNVADNGRTFSPRHLNNDWPAGSEGDVLLFSDHDPLVLALTL